MNSKRVGRSFRDWRQRSATGRCPCRAIEPRPRRSHGRPENVGAERWYLRQARHDLRLALGPPSGYVVKFTNGLTVYLSGDTGIHADMKTIVHDFHKANLAVLNLGPSAIAPEAAAFVINELVQPASVIASHPNEAVTAEGKLLPNSRTKAFIDLVKNRPVYLSLSGKTMEFDGNAKCVAGCS